MQKKLFLKTYTLCTVKDNIASINLGDFNYKKRFCTCIVNFCNDWHEIVLNHINTIILFAMLGERIRTAITRMYTCVHVDCILFFNPKRVFGNLKNFQKIVNFAILFSKNVFFQLKTFISIDVQFLRIFKL